MSNARIALVTGGAGGLGYTICTKLDEKGYRVVLTHSPGNTSIKETLADLKSKGHDFTAYPVDVADYDSCQRCVAQVQKDIGPIDILINNAGVVSGKALLEASEEEIERTFDVNVLALFWTTRAFLPAMLERKSGHIVTIASAAGIAGTSRLIDYCASKHAAVGFDEALRLELRRQGSKVLTTVVCPFYISTGMFEGVKTRFPLLLPILDPDRVADRIIDAIRKNRRRVLLPRFVYTTWLARILPIPAFDAIMEFFGINKSMDEFTGRH